MLPINRGTVIRYDMRGQYAPTHVQPALSKTLIILASMVGSSGCASFDGFQRHPEPSSVPIEARRALYYGPNADDDYYKAAPASRQPLRDKLVYGKMQVLEDDFQDFEQSLNSAGNYISIGGDLTALALSGAAAVTGTAATKSALAAASGGIVGAQGAINKDIYYQKTLPALIAQMQANRAKVVLEITQNLKQSDVAYPLSAAELDLQALREAGGLLSAVNDISQQATAQKNTSNAEIQKLQSLTFANTPSATKLQAWLYTGDKVDQAHYDALQDWLNQQSEPSLKGQNYPPAAFVSGDTTDTTLEPVRKRALADPKLNIPP
jgi:hypothetical protein